MPVDRRAAESAVARDARRPVGYDVWYPGRDDPVRYAELGRIDFQAARRITIVYERGSGGLVRTTGGDLVRRDRRKVR